MEEKFQQFISALDKASAFRIQQAERKRIIDLLERDICPDWTITCCDGWCAAYKGAIDLIKGEQQ